MLLFFFLTFNSFSWCPFLHQVIAQQFLERHLTNISESEKDSFLLGSVWADGLDKSITHKIQRLFDKMWRVKFIKNNKIIDLNNNDIKLQNDKENNDFYYFLLGIFSHIPPDTFAHAGKGESFIIEKGILHYFSEVVVDSVIIRQYKPKMMKNILPTGIRAKLNEFGIRESRFFRVFYPLVYLSAKIFPLHRFLPFVQINSCCHGITAYTESSCTLSKHVLAMHEALELAFQRLGDVEFNNLHMENITTNLVHQIGCCKVGEIPHWK
ncbi:hypothetical protein TRFO_40278 [Tritrichomonas foetus]|uniref:Phospholipase C/D domain-containing protein n=1 Tax=Tritrichomonas foetus TaxID=1144522 RepID=A0A1J4J1R7_9EUKA|nr:hypothetical protein TRFO_40278 [Tritrichomonas foetus]|eukprot:OHS93456.1 hypothetical protein TRFO_40278 [Tritrichomonas foetus]